MRKLPKGTRKSIAFLIVLAFCAGFLALQKHPLSEPKDLSVSDERHIHILYGDETGGGHFHTANKPCKSEFPESWDEEKVIGTIELIAANDNVNWRQEDNGYYVGHQKIEDINIRVVLNSKKTGIITAYPINVKRNACPANDNRKN